MSGRWIDPRPAAVHLPGYPAWVQSRVEALNRAYIAGVGMPHPELVYEEYSEMGGGSGRQILPSHMEWLAKMWLLGGPRLPAAEPLQVPSVLRLLGLFEREPVPLGEWLLELVVAFAREHGWACRLMVDLEHVGLRTSRIRYYWEFLMGVVETHSTIPLEDTDSQRKLLAGRVIRQLHHRSSLFDVLHGALSLESREVHGLVSGASGVHASLLDESAGTVLCGVAVRCVRQYGETPLEVSRRSGSLPEMGFVLWDPDEDVEVSLGVVHVHARGWRVSTLRRYGRASVPEGTRLRAAAEHVCRLLDQIGGLHPHVAKHMATSSAAESWRRLGDSVQQTGEINQFFSMLKLRNVTEPIPR